MGEVPTNSCGATRSKGEIPGC
uniref:Uncharacterized protein n=1 Tax=Timema douglasi TaxID=61478 RepID=A0A7R8W2R7_TIMDO|nr:unnamed protein product [Timema douglasi]